MNFVHKIGETATFAFKCFDAKALLGGVGRPARWAGRSTGRSIPLKTKNPPFSKTPAKELLMDFVHQAGETTMFAFKCFVF